MGEEAVEEGPTTSPLSDKMEEEKLAEACWHLPAAAPLVGSLAAPLPLYLQWAQRRCRCWHLPVAAPLVGSLADP